MRKSFNLKMRKAGVNEKTNRGGGMNNPNMDENGKLWRWAIEPHPYDSGYDIYVTDDDKDALAAIQYVAEFILWDGNEGGETVTMKVTLRSDVNKEQQ